jgi:hypothetical protein
MQNKKYSANFIFGLSRKFFYKTGHRSHLISWVHVCNCLIYIFMRLIPPPVCWGAGSVYSHLLLWFVISAYFGIFMKLFSQYTLNVEIKAEAKDPPHFQWILLHENIKTFQLWTGHNPCSWEFQHIVKRSHHHSMLKVVYFLRTKKLARFGVYFSILIHNLTQRKVSKIPKTFSYHFRTITNLTNIWHRTEQPWKSHTWTFDYHLPFSRSRCSVTWQKEVKHCKVSDGTRVVGKCHRNFLIPCCVWEWRNILQTVCKKYKTFSTERIVALRSVNKIFPGSYNFAATSP